MRNFSLIQEDSSVRGVQDYSMKASVLKAVAKIRKNQISLISKEIKMKKSILQSKSAALPFSQRIQK